MTMKMRRTLGGLVGAGALALAAAGPANATISSVSPSPVVNAGGITVVGTAPTTTGITQYALAICNTTATLGTKCSAALNGYTSPTAITPGAGFSNNTITNAAKSFSNFDFTTQSPGVGTTSCLGSTGVQCAVVASYYDDDFTPLGSDSFNITFS